MAISWFPGHMAKTRRLIADSISMVDIVAELCDARIPKSSRNPILDELLGNKPRILVMNKSDLSDPKANDEWLSFYRSRGIVAYPCDAMSGRGVDKLPALIRSVLKEKIEKDAQKGMKRSIRMMVVGVPNVGKSSLINRLSGKRATKVEDRPGVTRSKQWIRLSEGLELLDTPGILWPKFEEEETGLNLAFTGAIKDEVLDLTEVAQKLLEILAVGYPQSLTERYKIENPGSLDGCELLEGVGRRRGCVVSGGEIDIERAAAIILDEFRGGKLGKITLERPMEPNGESDDIKEGEAGNEPS